MTFSAPTVSWPGPTTRTSTTTREPRTGSRRPRRPTTSCPIRRRGAVTTRSGVTSGRFPRTSIPRRGGGAGAGRGGPGGFSFSEDDIDLDDLLGGIFGGRFGGARRGRGPVGPIPGADQEAEIELTVEEAYRGGRRSVPLSSGGRRRPLRG